MAQRIHHGLCCPFIRYPITNYDIDLLAQEMVALFDNEEDKRAISLLFNWFMQLWKNDKISREDYDKLDKVYREAEEVKTMLEATIVTYKQKLYDEGIEKGRVTQARGYIRGLVQYCYQLTGRQLEQVLDDIKWIDSIDELNELINTCLDGKPFDAFRSLLDEMLDDV
ncbi:MAG: hypothetical protein AAF639_17250 [Chloroflexota bacterium]